MTKLIFLFLIGALLFLVPLRQANSQTANIPDANLRTAINGKIDPTRADDADITIAEMGALTGKLSARHVADLTGLEHATELTELEISFHTHRLDRTYAILTVVSRSVR